MSDLSPDAVLDDRDVRAAQAAIDAWAGDTAARDGRPPGRPGPSALLNSDLLRLRGILAVQFADVRAAGVLEGYQTGLHDGRRQAVEDLGEALTDRGLL